ncbi:MAG: electron transfer flavoprotein subunit beta/FixA family protein [Stackebrandtia sp.]
MEILVCVKRVPGTGSQILLTDDERNVDTRHLGFTVGPHEECAVEEAVRIAAARGGRVVALTAGPAEADEQLRYAVAMGVDEIVRVDVDAADELDPQATAAAIVAGVRELTAEGRSFDLMLFGDETPDAGHSQVGVRVACELGLPMVGGVKGVDLDAAPGAVRLRREVADGVEVYESALPAAAAVKEGLNLPRYPSVKGRLRARKTRVRVVHTELRPGGLRKRRLRRPPEVSRTTVVLGHGRDAASAVVDVLEELEVV